MKQLKQLTLVVLALCLSGCANTRTVYRIDTVDGQAYYTRSNPAPEANGDYKIVDLDNNRITIKKRNVKGVSPYTYTIRL